MIQKDISIVVNSVDLSSSLRGLEFTQGQAMQEAAAHGDDFEHFEAGLRSGPVTAQFWNDFTSGGVDDTLSPLVDSTTATFTVVITPTSESVSTSNPSFTATMALENWDHFTGEIGGRALGTALFALASGSGWVRATS